MGIVDDSPRRKSGNIVLRIRHKRIEAKKWSCGKIGVVVKVWYSLYEIQIALQSIIEKQQKPFKYTKIPDVFTSGIGGGRWIRFSAEKPRRLRQSTGLSPRAAFRIHLHKFPNKEKRTIHADVASFWWGKVDSKTIKTCMKRIYSGESSKYSKTTTIYSV